MGQSSRPAVPDNPVVVENFLEFDGGGTPLSRCKKRLPPYVNRIEARDVEDERNLPQLERVSSLGDLPGRNGVSSIQRQLRLNRRQPKPLHLGVQGEAFVQV